MKKEFRYNPQLAFIRNDIKGNLVLDGEFVFKDKKDKLPYQQLIKWMTTRNPQYHEKKSDKFVPQVIHNTAFNHTAEDKLVWLGHSTFYIQLDGLRIITDPVFHSPSPFGLKRKHKLPCAVKQLNNIDCVVLSHGHRDHLDITSLKEIVQHNPDLSVLCPMGFTKLLSSCGFKTIVEMAWWQTFSMKNIRFVFLPAKHWNRRFLYDYNKELWGSFGIFSPEKSIYFAGDTGYDKHFKEIQNYISELDYCLMPIGAYKPKYVMEWAHTSPDEAVQACNELQGKHFIPMHYGTFDLSEEPASEPLHLLKKSKASNHLKAALHVLNVGEDFII